MFDPYTQVFHCRFFTIWHVDPCTDGTDDSCGWSYPKPTEEDRREIDRIKANKAAFQSWLEGSGVPGMASGAVWSLLLNCVREERGVYASLTIRSDPKFMAFFMDLCHDTDDPIEMMYRHGREKEDFDRAVETVHRCWRRFRRPWYKHPKYHFWHYSIQWGR